MTLNNKNKCKINTSGHILRVNDSAWFALQRAKITAIESGDPKTPGQIASNIILERLGGVNG